jgi:predicted Fe-S protein YdhL (DUF1289 family)
MITPCIKVCKIDPHTEICIGCKRYVEEIENWRLLNDEDRLCIMEQLKDRNNEPGSTEKLNSPID